MQALQLYKSFVQRNACQFSLNIPPYPANELGLFENNLFLLMQNPSANYKTLNA